MWKSIFETIGKALDFVRFWRQESTRETPPLPDPLPDEINPATQREGIAAGAAAHEAGHIVEGGHAKN